MYELQTLLCDLGGGHSSRMQGNGFQVSQLSQLNCVPRFRDLLPDVRKEALQESAGFGLLLVFCLINTLALPPAPIRLGRDGLDFFVPPPRRCCGIDSSSCLDFRIVALPTSANVFVGRTLIQTNQYHSVS